MAAPNDGVTLSELERQRLREIEDGLARVDGAFVARFASSTGMRFVAWGSGVAAVAFAVVIATFTVSLPLAFGAAVVSAGGAWVAACGGERGGWSGWAERLARHGGFRRVHGLRARLGRGA